MGRRHNRKRNKQKKEKNRYRDYLPPPEKKEKKKTIMTDEDIIYALKVKPKGFLALHYSNTIFVKDRPFPGTARVFKVYPMSVWNDLIDIDNIKFLEGETPMKVVESEVS